MNLTISSAVAKCIDGPTVIKVVEGEWCPNAGLCLSALNRGEDDSDCVCAADENTMRPPADLVALTGECETCGGEHPGEVVTSSEHWNCIDFATMKVLCHNGRKLVEVRVPCLCNLEDESGNCVDCANDGYTTLKGTIQVVPVYRDGRDLLERRLVVRDTPERCVVVRDDGKQFLLKHDGRRIRSTPAHLAALEADLGRPIAPGLFTVVFEAVEP